MFDDQTKSKSIISHLYLSCCIMLQIFLLGIFVKIFAIKSAIILSKSSLTQYFNSLKIRDRFHIETLNHFEH